MESPVTPEEEEQLRDTILAMPDQQLVEILESLASREIELLRTELGGDELREITLANVAALCAAVERLGTGKVDVATVTRGRPTPRRSGTSQG